MPSIEIVKPGALTTVQDLGRPGWGRWGICGSGALDPWALRLANLLVGNPESASALEITGPGTHLRFFGHAVICLVGADLGAHLGDVPLPPGQPRITQDKQRLVFSARQRGFRAILAIRGGICVPARLGSRATDMATQWPRGRLRANEMLEVEAGEAPAALRTLNPEEASTSHDLMHDIFGPPAPVTQLDFVPAAGEPAQCLSANTFHVSKRSNRTGFRLDPRTPCQVPRARSGWSEPVAPGSVQLPPDGHPILLLADAPSLGGYPVIGHLASVDRSRAAQLAPGDQVAFRAIDVAQAQAMARRRMDRIHRLARALSSGVFHDTP